jgi:hypothetical protein
LEKQGWEDHAGADGSVYYHPPQPVGASDQVEQPATTDVDEVDIGRLLLERGWRLETNARGDMLLIPVKPPAPPDIVQMLRERGWRILTDVDGNTLLMPLATAAGEPVEPTGRAQAQVAAAVPTAGDQPAASEASAQFRQALEGKGWRVWNASDGSMIVYPPASAPQASLPPRPSETYDSNGYCEGIELAGEEVDRPVDSEEKAKRLAGAWIAQFGRAGDEVGKARAVNQVFVISIVASAPPHSLRNQLVVRENGSIIALY